jgi:hypothetical protein
MTSIAYLPSDSTFVREVVWPVDSGLVLHVTVAISIFPSLGRTRRRTDLIRSTSGRRDSTERARHFVVAPTVCIDLIVLLDFNLTVMLPRECHHS